MKKNTKNSNDKNKNDKNKKNKRTMSHSKWIFIIVIWTIIISAGTQLLSGMLLSNADILVAFVILILIVLIGVTFDTIGTAVTAAKEIPFHAMASKKIRGAKTAIKMIRNADKVSNFCNDVIGDICGIVSGSAAALIVAKVIVSIPNSNGTLGEKIFAAGMSSLVAAMTVGGKALGKNIAINNSNEIIFKVAKIIDFVKRER